MPLSSDSEKRARQLSNLRSTPAPIGHARSLKHGATARKASLILAGSWAATIYRELAAEAPLRDGAGELPIHDRQVVELLASALARIQSVEAWLVIRPPVREDGSAWPVEEVLRALRREAAAHLDSLGMTPKSRAALGLDLVRAQSFDLAAHWAAESAGQASIDVEAEPNDVDDEGLEDDG